MSEINDLKEELKQEMKEIKQELNRLKATLNEYSKITNKIFDNNNIIIRYLYDCSCICENTVEQEELKNNE